MRLSVFGCPGATSVVTALSRECRAKTGALVVIHSKNEQSATKQFNVSQKPRRRPHVAGNPFVLAIQTFHEHGSLTFSNAAVVRYLYGIAHRPSWTKSAT
jgi:hypothetical protein